MRSNLTKFIAVLVMSCSAPTLALAQSEELEEIESIELELEALIQEPPAEPADPEIEHVLFLQSADDHAKVEREKKALEAALRRHEERLAAIEVQLREKENALRAREVELRDLAARRRPDVAATQRLKERIVALDVERAQAAARAAELAARRGQQNSLRFRAPQPGAGRGGASLYWGVPAPVDGTRSGARTSSLTITSVDGDVTVIMNGEKVDPSRIKKSDSGLQIIGPDGRIMREVPIQIDFTDSFDLTIKDPVVAKKRPIIGVQLVPLTDAVRHHTGLDSGAGVMIASLVPGRPAQTAGIEKFDVILTVQGQPVGSPADVSRIVQKSKPGDRVMIEVQRGSVRMQFDVTVAEGEVARGGDVPYLQGLPLLGDAFRGSTGLVDISPFSDPKQIDAEIVDLQAAIEAMLEEHEHRLEAHEQKLHQMLEERMGELQRFEDLRKLKQLEELKKLEELEDLHEELFEKKGSNNEL